jgi:hypothetical protein
MEYDSNIYVSKDLSWVLIDAYAKAIDKLCCVRCSIKDDCKTQDGSCFVHSWEE